MHAESSKRWLRILTILIPLLALTGCGEGDGQVRIQGTAATPLPPGFVAPAPTLGVLSETNADQIVIIQDIQQAGNTVVITTEFVRVFEGERSLGLSYTSGGQGFGGATILFEDADISAYNTLKFAIDTSTFADFANLTVQLEPPGGGTAGAFVALADYMPVATEGNWETYEIPLSAFPSVNLTLVNKLGFFNARDGSDALLAGTLYLDDIHFTVTDLGGSGGAAGTPIDPEVVIYATEGDLDLVIPDDYDEVTGLESGSVPNLNYADDDTYGKVLSVFSGIIDDTNVAQVGFIGFEPGFVTFYEDLIFKIKGMPNFVVFVTLSEDGDPVRINLTSSDYSDALGDGWYQVSIPLSSFTGLTTATGIVFASDDTAQMQFNMFLTDIGFSGTADDGGDGGDGGGGDIVLVTFDEAEPPAPGVFGNATASIEAGPAGGDGDALKITRSVTAFSGAFITIPAIPSDAGSQTVSAYVYSPKAGIRFVAKAEYASEQGTGEVDANEAVIAGWQTLTWTFTNLNAAEEYNVFVMLPNLDQVDTDSYYVDNITLVVGDSGGAGDGGTVLVTFDEAEPPAPGVFGNATASIEAGPAGGDGDALKITRSVTAFSGAFITIPAIPSDAGSQTVSAYVYSPKAGIRFVAKAEYASEQGTGEVDANEAVIAGWQTLTWTFANLNAAEEYNVFVMLPNLDQVDTDSYYVDNITLVGGNGGGGPVEGNLAVNGGFDDGFTGWAQYPSAQTTQTIVVDATTSSNVARLSIPASAGGVNNVLKQERLLDGQGVFSAGDIIEISFDYRGEAGEGSLFVKSICETAEPVCGDKIHNNGGSFVPAGWTNYTDTFTLGAGVTGYTLEFAAVCGATGSCVADYFIDNVSITIQ